MKTLYLAALLLIMNLFLLHSSAQNLVPNFSFEQMNGCPTADDQITLSIGWSKYSKNSSTPDYYNACSSSSTYGIPKNIVGYQQDHRNCSAYMGLITFGASGNDREHIGIQLSQPLVIGQKYFISFYTVMGEDLIAGTQFGMPSNNIGMRLSTVAYSSSNPAPIDNFSHLRATTIITDSTNWVRISGSIVADSAYSYLILGNFYDDANTDTLHYTCGGCLNSESYYFVDDICISTDSSLCNGGIDAIPCNVSVEENELNNQVNIFPNPSNGIITISLNEPIKNYTIYSSLGELIINNNPNTKNIQINLTNHSAGIYYINIQTTKSNIIKKFIIN
jgi:hypothetical protein